MMNSNHQKIMIFIIVLIGLQSIACQQKQNNYTKIEPAHVDHIEGSELNRLTLTQRAVDRIEIKTDTVSDLQSTVLNNLNSKLIGTVPYSSILYDSNGKSWVYKNSEPLVYSRHEIQVDFIEGNTVALLDGPAPGTTIVTQGAAELFGIEFKVGH